MTIKFCTKCGKQFYAIGREVICPDCKAQAAEDAKKAAVLKAKRASWAGESVPVRISGRASTIIREYGAAHDVPFAVALDDLLKASAFFKSTGKTWEEVKPYKSHRRDKTTTETAQDEQDATESKPQDVQDEPVKPVKQAAKTTNKTSASKTSASKASTSKTTGKAASTSKK